MKRVSIIEKAFDDIEASRRIVDKIVGGDTPVYGLILGFAGDYTLLIPDSSLFHAQEMRRQQRG
ncbi:MAG: hypothetical protein DRO11_07740 [Methanobacteriota archaeon]|nr:MAG: hypothetical protein DRO11_07740 [Euryarchaeota archaeon]